jgi:hypothetical protein
MCLGRTVTFRNVLASNVEVALSHGRRLSQERRFGRTGKLAKLTGAGTMAGGVTGWPLSFDGTAYDSADTGRRQETAAAAISIHRIAR